MLAAPTWAEVMALIRDHTLRTFRIEVETDSTLEPNDQQEKQRRVEFIQAVGEYVSRSMPALQLAPAMTPVICEGLKFLVRGFRVGREMEEVIDKALDQLQAGGLEPPPQPPQSALTGQGGASPAEQVKAQASMTSAQAKANEAATRQFEAQTDRFRAQAEAHLNGARIGAENLRTAAEQRAELAMHQDQIRADLQQAVLNGVNRRFVRDMNSPDAMKAPTP
jgi:hypothetical protein